MPDLATNDGVEAFAELKIGSPLKLLYEPDNGHDPQAVCIMYKDFKLGYVPRDQNKILHKLLKIGFKGLQARVQRISPEEHPEHQVAVVVHLVS